MIASKLITIQKEMRAEYGRIMDYWIGEMTDNEKGGFYGERDKENRLMSDAPKGCILNGRMLWSFSSAARHFGKQEYRDAADRAYRYLVDYFYDKENGGFFWSLNAEGTPLDTKKQAYAQGFCIYGLSEYYMLTKDVKALNIAYETYENVEQFFRDSLYGGYIEALDRQWKPLDDMRLSEKEINVPKSMNTHLHLLEPFTNLYRAKATIALKESIQHCVSVFTSKIINPKTGRFGLFFDMDWTCTSNIDSYGHDIEGAWLIYEAAEVIGDTLLMEQLRPICKRLVDVTVDEGWDDDSIFNEKIDGHLDTDKHWWPQAEAMVGLTDTWRLTGDESYLERMTKVWSFISTRLIDREKGEWLWRVDRDGQDIYKDPKAGFWKCPYHNSRALIEVLNRLDDHK